MKQERRKSRRGFLKTALAGAAAAAIVKRPAASRASTPERERLERLAARYGSELGELRRTGEGS
jgi:hypothetical protein